MTDIHTRRGSLVQATLVMIVLSIALFWLPLVGPLVAGVVGGRIARRVGTALLAALLPAILLGGLILLVLTAFTLPVVGAVAGGAVFLAMAIQDVPLLVGAWAGAALSR